MVAGLALVMFIFCMISVSEVGFPYRARTNVMRLHFLVSYCKLLIEILT